MKTVQVLKNSIVELRRADVPGAELDATILLEKVLKKDRAYILTHDLELMTNAEYAQSQRLILRRKKGEPIAYITGHKEFFGYDFYVNKNVLIPRPESELLVENTLEYLKNKISSQIASSDCHCEEFGSLLDDSGQATQSRLPRPPKRPRNDRKKLVDIIDVGTGSGCIIISLCKYFLANKFRCFNRNPDPKASGLTSYRLIPSFFASDISKKALYMARKNARLHKVNSDIRFFHSDLFANKRMPKKYDIIISNLPYVPKNNLELKTNKSKLVRGIYYEPRNAIFALDNGTKIIKRFLDQTRDRINKGGLILIEVDPRNVQKLKKYAKNIYPDAKIEIKKDLAKLDRVIKILN